MGRIRVGPDAIREYVGRMRERVVDQSIGVGQIIDGRYLALRESAPKQGHRHENRHNNESVWTHKCHGSASAEGTFHPE
jgi:hypothetical protein